MSVVRVAAYRWAVTSIDDLLDRLPGERVDSEAVRDQLAGVEELPEDEQSESMFEIRAGGHILESLLFESHNATVIVRDLTGELRIICEDPPGTWTVGPLTADHLAEYRIDEIREGTLEGFEEVDADLIAAILGALPGASGLVRSY